MWRLDSLSSAFHAHRQAFRQLAVQASSNLSQDKTDDDHALDAFPHIAPIRFPTSWWSFLAACVVLLSLCGAVYYTYRRRYCLRPRHPRQYRATMVPVAKVVGNSATADGVVHDDYVLIEVA
ncbi:hypothetical protein AC1031_019588 [Aphanomyces cochlioides]|nr:hypothetical protein AC1031_019588 [Aphanomyces cochlioides]